jgi:hypothetical protein
MHRKNRGGGSTSDCADLRVGIRRAYLSADSRRIGADSGLLRGEREEGSERRWLGRKKKKKN